LSPNLFGQFVDRAAERYDTTFRGTDTIRGMIDSGEIADYRAEGGEMM